MAEDEDFLTRWSRRKREAAKASDPVEQPERSEAVPAKALPEVPASAPQASGDPTKAGGETPGVEFDLSKLPSLDSIGADTDIRVFLQPGVPAALSRAALRRAWSADPTIRDFVGLAENSWDFTKSDSMPGFGALDPAEVKRLLAQLLDGQAPKNEPQDQVAEQAAEEASNDLEPAGVEASEPVAPRLETASEGTPPDESQSMLHDANSGADSAAPQHNETERLAAVPPRVRTHGRALPQ